MCEQSLTRHGVATLASEGHAVRPRNQRSMTIDTRSTSSGIVSPGTWNQMAGPAPPIAWATSYVNSAAIAEARWVFVVHYRIRQTYDVHVLMRIQVVQDHCISCARILCGLLSLISQTDFAAILDAKLAAYLPSAQIVRR